MDEQFHPEDRSALDWDAALAAGEPFEKEARLLQQVLLNLILNAVDAMSGAAEETRDLLISTEQDEAGGARVAVRDSGPGLSPESLGRLFDAFYTTKTAGMGMGLSICRSIVEAHGGRVWAAPNEPRGAVFQFTLPREKETVE
jgi:signal transduction histidine kinase